MRDKTLASRDATYVLAAGVLLPLVAVALLLWGLGGRTSSMDDIPVAIVNNDKPVTGDHPMAAGRALAAELTDPSSSTNESLDWTLTDADDARAGLRDGEYYSVLTIPSDFSQSVLSSGTDHPVRATVTLESNAAASATVGLVSQGVAQAAASALGTQVTENFVTTTLNGLDQESKSLADAAANAESLAGGTSELSHGAAQVSASSRQLAAGTGRLSSGAVDLAAGARDLAGGANEVASGMDELDSGVDAAHRRATSLSSRIRHTDGRARSLAARTHRSATEAGDLSATARGLRTGAWRTSSGASSVSSALQRLDQLCAAASTSAEFCAELNQVTQRSERVAGTAATVAADTSSAASSARRLSRRTAVTSRAADRLGDRTAGLGSRADQASDKTRALRTSVDELADGADSVATGATTLSRSASQLATAAGRTSSGAAELADGNAKLASSAVKVDQGAQSLGSGLADGAKKAPTYTSDQVKQLSKVVGQPVALTAKSQHDTVQNAWLTGAVVGLVLWFGALAGMFLRARLSAAAGRMMPVSSSRLAALRLVPRLSLALAQALVVLVALLVFRQDVTSAFGFGAFTLLGAVVFSLVADALHAGLHRAGSVAFLLLSAVQLAAIGNVIPVQTAPGVLQSLNGLLPLTTFVNGAAQFASGGHVHSVAALIATLVLWGLAALAVVLVQTRRNRGRVPSAVDLVGVTP